MLEKRRKIAVITTSRADYSHLYWPLRTLADRADVDLRLIVLGAHLSPEFGRTVEQIEKDGFPIAARVECLLSSDSRVISMGEEDWRVHRAGAPSLDHLTRSTLLTRPQLEKKLRCDFEQPPILVSYHPVTLAKNTLEETDALF